MKKILIVFGTRPEAIKMSPIVIKLKQMKNVSTKVLVTGQHREMLDQVLELFKIKPDYDLNIMKFNQTLAELTSNIVLKMDNIFKEEKFDYVLVHGDTTTSMAVGLSAFYHQIPIAHVEAGLRTNDIFSPWPEEANRQINTVLSSLHFAPTLISKNNLIKENVNEKDIVITGNTVIDALLIVVNEIKQNQELQNKFLLKFNFLNSSKKIILVTAHRRENFGLGFENICKALLQLSQNEDVQIVFPVHLNPNVRHVVNKYLSNVSNIFLIEPLDYLEFVYIMNLSYFILTDSGGVQEEAPALGKPVLVMRETTERPEAVEAGTVVLVGASFEKITLFSEKLLKNDLGLYDKMSKAHNPYGSGNSVDLIIECLLERNKGEDYAK